MARSSPSQTAFLVSPLQRLLFWVNAKFDQRYSQRIPDEDSRALNVLTGF